MFSDEAQKRSLSVEAARCGFEEDIAKGKTRGIVAPDKALAICFELDEIEDLCSELMSGKICLSNLADQLSLNDYQTQLVIQHLLKTKRIEGDLTYSTFTSKPTLKKTSLQKATEHKHIHRLKMRNKRT